MSAVGVALRVGNATVAALSVAAINDRMSKARVAEIAALLHEEARLAQSELAPTA